MPGVLPDRHPALAALLEAKAHSDARRWAAKHAVLRRLIAQDPAAFVQDSDLGNGIVGVTHVPTNFRIHIPGNALPSPLALGPAKAAADLLTALDPANDAGPPTGWEGFAARVYALAEKAAVAWRSPGATAGVLWCDPDATETFAGPGLPPGFGERAWLPVKVGNAFRPLADALQLTPNPVNALAGGPTPLAGMLAGGLLGAGLGYGGGWLGEKTFGKNVLEPGRLRRTTALAGGLLGALPGLYLGSVGARMNAEDGKPALRAFVEPNALLGKEGGFDKLADEAGALFVPSIPVDAFNRVVWADPSTPVGVRAAATGLVEGASALRGGAEYVTPFDVGRIAAGMGSGLASGMLVGKALGALAGLTPGAQRTLKQTGMWAGALVNIVPRAFGY